jgi:acylphosphatase
VTALPLVAVRVRVTGLVHGVFFRATLAQVAADNEVRGWVRNRPDGSVEAFLEGEEESVRRVIAWAKRGPPRARVDGVHVARDKPKNLQGFRIEG